MGAPIMTRLYLVRHCETYLNSIKVYYGRTDCSLNKKGVLQAQQLMESFKGISIDTIISSPLKRCTETAEMLTSELETEITLEPNFIELDFGLWEGLHYKEISEKYREQWEKWVNDWKNSSPPKGESFYEMLKRVQGALEKILNQHKGQNVLIVSHKGCLQIIASLLLVGDDRLFWNLSFEHGTYTLLESSDETWIMKKLNAL